ncbi:hypothetical protein LOTGIDRAFT_235825 [Lottia gigantea]|uniref:Uncharacterized protein n=1 Tax=Lottia gigantea TaxID=225164 RepID=V3ZWK9_LOTGI|nr:hypothetical protein LOTGIDRAFT_235825 [Lottia gigantea]ESO85326.1 hypothetical protein LOTGIDRAFT_235825 [Lottia gigantea]
MGETYLHVTSPEVYSKRFSEYVKQFHSEDSDDVTKDDKRQKVKNEEAKRDARGKRFIHSKRMSESNMLPPINVKTDVSSPTFTNGMWSFRGSNRATQGSLMRSVAITNGSQLKESHASPARRHAGNKLSKTVPMTTSLDVNKSPDSLRLTPIFKTEKRAKTDKKNVSKSSENTPRLVPNDSQKHKSKGQKNSKHKNLEEPFSIRRKIEQFKRYHEEQYLIKLQKLKQDSEIKIELSKRRPSPVKEHVAKEREVPRIRSLDKISSRTDQDTTTSADDADSGNESAFNLSTIIKSTASRQKSAKTWRTWRDVNDSYAYTDVNKYIVDNELMTAEKAEWIRDWTVNVNKELFQNNGTQRE